MPKKKQIDWILNKSDKPFKKEFKGKVITIPPNGKKAVEMNRRDRVAFLGTYQAFDLEGKNDIDSEGVMPLYWEMKEPGEYEDCFTCNVCGWKFEKQLFLDNHILETHKGQPAAVAPK